MPKPEARTVFGLRHLIFLRHIARDSSEFVIDHSCFFGLHFARRRRTGTLILCGTRLAVVPKTKSARKRCPCVLIATKSQPFCRIHLTISVAGSPNANS